MAKQDKPTAKDQKSVGKKTSAFSYKGEPAKITYPFKKGDKQNIALAEKKSDGKHLSSKELAAKGDSLMQKSLQLKKQSESKLIDNQKKYNYQRESKVDSAKAMHYYKAAELKNKKK